MLARAGNGDSVAANARATAAAAEARSASTCCRTRASISFEKSGRGVMISTAHTPISSATTPLNVSETSIHGLLYRESQRLFPDDAFTDLFADIGPASAPPRIVLQRLEGLSDREAVDRITFDLRWKYAAGGLDFDYAGFVHTVLVDMRARLRRSAGSSPRDRVGGDSRGRADRAQARDGLDRAR